MKNSLQVLRANVAADREALDLQYDELHEVSLEGLPTKGDLAVVAVALHNTYQAVERILERIAREIDRSVPSGPDWHRQLLRTMSLQVDDVRPAVVGRTAHQGLGKLLDFRHFFRHGSVAISLDRDRLAELQAVAFDIEPTLRSDLDRLDAFLRDLIAAAD